MKDQDSTENWKLEEGGESDDRWVLQESEQKLSEQWDLQDEPPEGVGEWQPVEYEKPHRRSTSWILPTIVVVALLAVLGYSAVTLVPRLYTSIMGAETPEGGPTEVAAGATPTAGAAGVTGVVTPTELPAEEPEPTPTVVPPTQVPTPSTVEDFVQQLFGTVTSTYGVNARGAPDPNAEVVRVILQGETMFVLGEEGDYLKIFLSDAPLVEGQPITGTIAYAAKEYFAVAEQPIRRAFWEAVLQGAGLPTPGAAEPTPAPETPATEEPAVTITETGTTTTGALLLPTPTPSPEPGSQRTTAAPVAITLTISAVNGLNVRTNPEITADIVSLLENGATVDAIGRYVDNNWYKVRLPDGSEGWVAAEFVVLSGDPTALSVTTLEDLPLPTPAPTVTPTVAAGAVTPVPPPAPYVATLEEDVTGVVVPTANGVNVRTEPNTEADVILTAPLNAALPAVGRSADGLWILVELPEGNRGWLFRAAIIPNADLDALPVTDETGTVATPEATPAAAATPEATAEAATPAAPATGTTATVRSIVAPIYPQPTTEVDNIEVVARGTTLTVTGRNEAGDWVQVLSRTGGAGWVPAGSVTLDVAVTTLPVVP